MSDQWIHDFIETRILDDRFEIEEFVDFTATISSCDVPIFSNMISPWNLTFEFDENNHFKWKAIEFEDEYDLHGVCVLEGNLKISKSDFPKNWYPTGLEKEPEVLDFINSMFPKSNIELENDNFIIDGETISFDTMECDYRYIYLDFVNLF